MNFSIFELKSLKKLDIFVQHKYTRTKTFYANKTRLTALSTKKKICYVSCLLDKQFDLEGLLKVEW